MRKSLIITAIIITTALPLFSEDAAGTDNRDLTQQPVLQVNAAAEFPLEFETDLFETVGLGTQLQGSFPFPGIDILYLGGNIGYSMHRLRIDNSLHMAAVSLGGGVQFDITKRFQLSAGAGAGGYIGFLQTPAVNEETGDQYEHQSGGAMYWQAGVEANFFLHPAFSIGLFGSYNHYAGLLQGVRAGAFVSLNFDGLTPNVINDTPQFETVFPAFSKSYEKDSGLGSFTFYNGERFPLEDVQLSFQINELMSEPVTCAAFRSVEPGERLNVALRTVMGTSGLKLTEDTQQPGVVRLSYEIAGGEKTLEQVYTLNVLNRNALVWDDDTKAAAFVNAKDEDVLRFAKNVAGLIQESGRSSVNFNLRAAMAMFEALGSYRVSYVRDPHSPAYEDTCNNVEIVDFIQYPNQTLKYRGGDCDDLTILYCSLLEAIGIETAFVTVPGHIFPAVNMNLYPEEVRKIFQETDDFIILDGKTWLPVEITLVGHPFSDAWRKGADEWLEAAAEDSGRLYSVEDAWEVWENSGSPDDTGIIAELAVDDLRYRYRDELNKHIGIQLADLTEPVLTKLESRPGDQRLLNRLGFIYAYNGLLAEAEETLLQVLEISDYKSASINLGNVYLLQERPFDAIEMFEEVLAVDPDNANALAGMASASFLAGEKLKIDHYLARLEEQQPEMSIQIAYLGETDDSSRASSVHIETTVFWAE